MAFHLIFPIAAHTGHLSHFSKHTGSLTASAPYFSNQNYAWDFPGGQVVKNPPVNAGNMSYIPGPGRSHMLCGN